MTMFGNFREANIVPIFSAPSLAGGQVAMLGFAPKEMERDEEKKTEIPKKGSSGCPLKLIQKQTSLSPDLPLPHGLAPSETMVWDHGLNPPLSTENPRCKGFSGSGAPIFGFGLADPAPKG